MKARNQHLPINTLPKGVYEGGMVNNDTKKKKTATEKELVQDSQGNGYQVSKK